MATEPTQSTTPAFPGFPDFRANVTFVPIQFFTVVLPRMPLGVVRLVGYLLRRVLGWVDENGNPTCERVRFTWRELIESAGVSRDCIRLAIQEEIQHRLICCLRPPLANKDGQHACSGIYELCWDTEGPYTNSPLDFRGFYYPEAAVMPVEESGRVVARPRAARKNIPNAFFDYLLPRESLTVIRVVGALLFYSIRWGPGGERKQPVTLSITQLSRLTGRTRQQVHTAVTEARERGYIEQVDSGCFDPHAGRESRPATYRIRWMTTAQSAVKEPPIPPAPERKGVPRDPAHPQGSQGGTVQILVRERSVNVNGERSEKVNGMSIKTEHKTSKTTAADQSPTAGSLSEGPTAAAAEAVELLTKAGFDQAAAEKLAQKRPLDVIRRQIEWLPLRNTSRNRLGLLRRAIEQDWAKPEGGDSHPANGADVRLARTFAVQYYAACHGYTGEPATEPFAKDLPVAAAFVERLLALERDENRVPEWGRGFGQLIRAKLQRDPQAKPYLSAMLGLYGNEFMRQCERGISARQKSALGKARDAHQDAFRAEYDAYVRQAEIALQKGSPDLYAAFLEHQRKTRRAMTGGLFLATADTIARFDGEASRLAAFAEFFREHPQHPVLDFWEWDARHNPRRFGAVTTPTFQETPA